MIVSASHINHPLSFLLSSAELLIKVIVYSRPRARLNTIQPTPKIIGVIVNATTHSGTSPLTLKAIKAANDTSIT